MASSFVVSSQLCVLVWCQLWEDEEPGNYGWDPLRITPKDPEQLLARNNQVAVSIIINSTHRYYASHASSHNTRHCRMSSIVSLPDATAHKLKRYLYVSDAIDALNRR